jgi:dienelactone hydrolase
MLVCLFTNVVDGADDAAVALRELDPNVIPADVAKEKKPSDMLWREAKRRMQAANQRETAVWRTVKNREDWEKFRDARLARLRASLGQFPEPPADLKIRTTSERNGEGFRIENLVFESRPGLLATANLYVSEPLRDKMPGILIIPSHHNPKTQSELQDMGMTWARLGCLVLVMDQLGHGERRQHPFVNEQSYPKPYRASRQDYFFRYNNALQLDVIGDSLMGWMVWDYMRGIDLLLGRKGIDREKIIVLGSVAGGGDPAAVLAALDKRVTAAAIFNFGGPQPETIFPLPEDAEARFNYAGGGSWESTRNIRRSAAEGFMPWVIVGIAPRRLVYAHEFAWDKDHDPVWTRLQTIYGWYEVPGNVGGTHGKGKVTLRPPEATHCNNIGPVHRAGIYPLLKQWFGMPVPEKEYQERRPSSELQCLTDKVREELKPKRVHELALAIGTERATAARQRRASLSAAEQRKSLREAWARVLGDVDPSAKSQGTVQGTKEYPFGSVTRVALEVEGEVVIPVLLLTPLGAGDAKRPVVVAIAQEGKQAFLKQRSSEIAALLKGGATICLADLRGTGETSPGGRGRQSSSTSLSATEEMLGQTLLGARLRDLRSVLKWLRTRERVDAGRIALWGDSFAPTNDSVSNVAIPLEHDLPPQSEPLGGLLALLGPLFEEDVCASYGHGGIVSYASLLGSPFCYFPHDVAAPGAMTTGDLGDVIAALAPQPLRLEGRVDGLNCRVSEKDPAAQIAGKHVSVAEKRSDDVAGWLLEQVKTRR